MAVARASVGRRLRAAAPRTAAHARRRVTQKRVINGRDKQTTKKQKKKKQGRDQTNQPRGAITPTYLV